MKKKRWFSGRTIFRHKEKENGNMKTVYEERIVLFTAKNFNEAISKAEKEARKYCCAYKGVAFLGFVDAYELVDSKIGSGTEIFSLMRESNLAPKKYLDRFFDTGKERASTWKPS
ncbi:MAG: DUF4288 domain-containing protein [Planctomycetes bacterium]|nr:DUF4288 domain-containing protein [Planctomycetota bacterium]